MNIKIHKYSLGGDGTDYTEPFVLELPYESQLLDAAFVGKEPILWAMHHVEHEKTLVKRKFFVMVTGEEKSMHYLWKYFKTLFHPDGLIFHLFHYNE